MIKRANVRGCSWEVVRAGGLAAWSRVARRHHMTGNTWVVLEQILRLQWWQSRSRLWRVLDP